MKRILLDAGAGGEGGGGGTTPPAWNANIPEELRNHPTLKTIPDLPTLAKNYVSAQTMIGMKRLAVPGPNDPPEKWNEVYNTLGRPETADKYSKPTAKPTEGITLDEAGMKKTYDVFHKLGISDSQAKGVLDHYINGLNETHSTIIRSATEARAASEQALKQEWGDKYDANLDIAKSALRKFSTPEALQEIESGLGNNPALIKMFHNIGTNLLEDSARRGAGGSNFQVGAEAQGLQQIEELKADVDFQKALNDRTNPGHKRAVDLWTSAHQKAYPGKAE